MPKTALTEARIRNLKPRKSTYEVRDTILPGFGVRVLPSGTRSFFIHAQVQGERTWKNLGGANSLEAARGQAAILLEEIRRSTNTTLFETVAEAVFRRHARVWKAGTLRVNRGYLNRQILPAFSGRDISEITQTDVRQWFASLRATPVAADRSMPVLSVIFREAEHMGLRPEGSNPCRGIRRYRRKGRERYLSNGELHRLAAILSAREKEKPLEVAAIRLLLLTGCRHNEILTLRRSDYRDGHLFLRDSKTGPRTVWLSQAAREVLKGIHGSRVRLFPGLGGNPTRGLSWLERFWHKVRAEAGLPDVRLHDLRHTYASFALKQGESVLVIGRLLGHASPDTTLKYTHLADGMVRDAAESVGSLLGG